MNQVLVVVGDMDRLSDGEVAIRDRFVQLGYEVEVTDGRESPPEAGLVEHGMTAPLICYTDTPDGMIVTTVPRCRLMGFRALRTRHRYFTDGGRVSAWSDWSEPVLLPAGREVTLDLDGGSHVLLNPGAGDRAMWVPPLPATDEVEFVYG